MPLSFNPNVQIPMYYHHLGLPLFSSREKIEGAITVWKSKVEELRKAPGDGLAKQKDCIQQAFKAHEFLRNDTFRAAYDAELRARRAHALAQRARSHPEQDQQVSPNADAARQETARRALDSLMEACGFLPAAHAAPADHAAVRAESRQTASEEDRAAAQRRAEELAYLREKWFLQRERSGSGGGGGMLDLGAGPRREVLEKMGPEARGKERARMELRVEELELQLWGMERCPL